jgi:hypothetical protein
LAQETELLACIRKVFGPNFSQNTRSLKVYFAFLTICRRISENALNNVTIAVFHGIPV